MTHYYNLNDLPLLDFAVDRRPFLLEHGQAVLCARSADHIADLQHPVDGILHIRVGVEL